MLNNIVINLLIGFFVILILTQMIMRMFITIEGMDSKNSSSSYKEYDTNDPNNAMILAQQNAGNIMVLKERVDDLSGLDKQMNDITTRVDNLEKQVSDLSDAQQQYASDMVGTTPPDIQDEEEDTTEDTTEDTV